MKRGFFSSSKPSTTVNTDTVSAPAALIRPPTFAASPLDNPATTLHWSFHVPPSVSTAAPTVKLPPPINRASPTNPIAAIALHITSSSLKLLKPQVAFISPLPSSSVLAPAYIQAERKGKGRGLITTREVKQGETLFYDRPLLIFDSVRGPRHRGRGVANKEFEYALAYLMQEKRNIFYKLHNAYAGTDKALGIIDTNAASIITLDGDDVTYSGIFPTFARINHSCDPNVGIEFDAKLGALRVFSIKSIAKGEELETTYIITAQRRRERRSQLMHQVDFFVGSVQFGQRDSCSFGLSSIDLNASAHGVLYRTKKVRSKTKKGRRWQRCASVLPHSAPLSTPLTSPHSSR